MLNALSQLMFTLKQHSMSFELEFTSWKVSGLNKLVKLIQVMKKLKKLKAKNCLYIRDTFNT